MTPSFESLLSRVIGQAVKDGTLKPMGFNVGYRVRHAPEHRFQVTELGELTALPPRQKKAPPLLTGSSGDPAHHTETGITGQGPCSPWGVLRCYSKPWSTAGVSSSLMTTVPAGGRPTVPLSTRTELPSLCDLKSGFVVPS